MLLRSHAAALVSALVSALGAAGCGSTAPTPLLDALPPQLAIRSDTPYVGGRVLSYEPTADGGARIHVRGSLTLSATEAVVTVRASTLVLWHDGRPARPTELSAGRTVVVWTRDYQPPGAPPAVLADAVLVDGR